MNEKTARAMLKALHTIPYIECDNGLFGKYVISARHNGCGSYFFVCSVWDTRAVVEKFVKETLIRSSIIADCDTITICLVELRPEFNSSVSR